MSGDHNMNLYGDGTVYRGERSADSKGVTYTMHDLISAKGVSEPLREAVKVLQKEHGALRAAVKTLQGEKAELIEALCQPSYEEENRLRAEVAKLRAELSTEKGWVEDYKRQVVSLQNRLEVAETEALEQARLNGMGAERELALMAKLEAAEKEIAAMKQQVPVCRAEDLSHAQSLLPYLGLKPEDPLYALPGAQPAPSVPDEWLPIPEKHPTFDPVDLQLSDGSVLCGCVPQSDGDYWWEGPSGEVFIDPKYANVTHWRLAAAPKPGAQDTDATTGTQAQTSLMSVPVGWKLVPIEPTPEMLASAWGIDSCDIESTYSTMLAAAPEAKP